MNMFEDADKRKVVDELIQQLQIEFSPPRRLNQSDLAKLLAAISKRFMEMPEDVSRETMRILPLEHQKAYMPTMPEILLVAEMAKKNLADANAAERFKNEAKNRKEKPYDEVFARGHINSLIGTQAAREGWIIELWEFLCEKSRLPNGTEVDDLILSYKRQEAKIQREQETGDAGPMFHSVYVKARRRRQDNLKAQVSEHV